jgi:hypothetical protein
MPALFAYLIAVGLLLGGGYGALSWLAAPEPVKVVARAKPKPKPHYEATSPEVGSSDASSLAGNDSDRAASGSNDRPPSSQAGASAGAKAQDAQAVVSQDAQAVVSGPAPDLQTRSADAEVSPADAKQEATQPVEAASPAVPSNRQAAASIPAAAAKTVKRPHLRQAGGRSEKPAERRALELMTLRTIEFPDGRRVTQLIPYRGSERASQARAY